MKRIPRILFLVLACCILLPANIALSDSNILDFIPAIIRHLPYLVESIKDITYYKGEDPEAMHQLDIYYCPRLKNQKIVFFVHGGAWRSGDKSSYDEFGHTLAGYHGFTVVAINYELSNEDDSDANHPDHIQDVARAFAWVKANIAPYGDPEKIIIFAQSAGGHLVSLMGTDEDFLIDVVCTLADVQGVVTYSGSYELYDLTITTDNPLGLNASTAAQYHGLFLTTFFPATEIFLKQASPEWQIHLDQPPFLVVDVVDDMLGFSEEAINLVGAINGLSIRGPGAAGPRRGMGRSPILPMELLHQEVD